MTAVRVIGNAPFAKVYTQLIDENDEKISVQYPLPTDGDSVYAKDIYIERSDSTNWVGSITSPFNDLHSELTNSTTDNPKDLLIHFNRTIYSNAIGFGSVQGGSFSNLKIEFIGSGDTVRYTYDDSADNTKRTSFLAETIPLAYNAIRLRFYTADKITLSNITIRKAVTVDARLKALKPDGTVTDIDATTGGNLKMSLEEIESGISTNSNSQLNVSPFIKDEYGNYNHILGDNGFKGAIIAIPPEHHEIHCGDSYTSHNTADLGNGAVIDYLVITPNWGNPVSGSDPMGNQTIKVAHFIAEISGESETLLQFYESPTVTSNGTALNIMNRNRNSTNVDYLSIYKSSTVSAVGTLLDSAQFGSGKTIGGGISRTDEWVLKNNTTYLIRVTNNTTSNNYHTIRFQYYIHPGV